MADSDVAPVVQTLYLENVTAKFDKNRPFVAITLLITVGNEVKSQEIKEGEPIKWTEKIDCTGAETCTLKLFKSWNGRFPKLLVCVDIPLQGLVAVNEPYIIVKDGFRFTLTFSSLHSQQGTVSTGNPEISDNQTILHESLNAKFVRVDENVENARVAADDQHVLLDVLGSARDVAELMGSLGLAAGEMNSYAKAAVSSLATLAKLFKKQEDCYKATKDLVKELKEFLQLKEQALELKDRKETTAAVERMLELVARISDYISEHATTRRFGNMLSSKLKDKVEEFKKDFARAKDSFDRSVDLDILKTVHDLAQQFQLQRLQPAEALYQTGEDHICLEGTRQNLLNRASLWLSQSPERFFWVFGLAGSGKSAVANTIAMIISQMDDIDLTCYFCKRDDPVLSKAERFIPTIAFLIARKHSGYRARLIEVLSKSDGIPIGDIQKQYDLLIGGLLPNVADPLRTHAVIIDALDECGSPVDQHKIATCMLSLASEVPWIKVFVTSRPEPEICDTLADRTLSLDINQEEDTAADIELFIRLKLETLKLTIFDDKVDELVQRAAGLFIWCSTLFKYLGASRNAKRDMRNFLSGTTKQDPLLQLYELYDRILTSVVDMAHPEDNDVLQAILGIIYVCSSNRPLSAEAIACFLQHDSRFIDEDSDTISSLTRALHAVLYEESTAYRALRVYHPSFLDYLERKLKDNSTTNLSTIHELMASGCLEIMHEGLKFNICCLENPHCLNRNIQDFSERIRIYISEALQYSSLFWFHHIFHCGNWAVAHSDIIRSTSLLVMSPEALFWLEVLSWLDALADGLLILRGGCTFFEGEIAEMISDLERFVAVHLGAMESAPHIYLSALAWLPEETLAYRTLSPCFTHLPIIANKESRWEGARWESYDVHQLRCVTYAPSGQHFATGWEDGWVHVWDARTFKQVHWLRDYTKPVSLIAFSPDGRWLAFGYRERATCICIWDLVTGERHETLVTYEGKEIIEGYGRYVYVTSLAFSPDSMQIASVSNRKNIKIWEVESGNMVFDQNLSAHSIAFSTDGNHIFSGSESLQVWDVRSGASILVQGHFERISQITRSQDGKYIAAKVSVHSESNHSIKLWDAHTYSLVGELNDIEDTACLSFTEDSEQVYICSRSGSIYIWLTETFELIKRTDLLTEIYEASFSSDFRSILVRSERAASIFDVQPGVADESPNTSLGEVNSVAISPDARYIASCHRNSHCIHVWDAETGAKAIEPLRGHLEAGFSVTFSNDGRWLISGSFDRSIRLWDIFSNWISKEPLLGHAGLVDQVVVSPDNNLIASCSRDETARIWEISTCSLVKTFNLNSGYIYVTFFPDGRRIVAASAWEGAFIFDILTGDLITRFSDDYNIEIYSVSVSPDCRWIGFRLQESIYVWNVTSGVQKCLGSSPKYYLTETLFTPDSQYVFARDNRFDFVDISCWNIESGVLSSKCSLVFPSGRREHSAGWTTFSPGRKRIILEREGDDGSIIVRYHWRTELAFLEEDAGDNSVGRIRRVRWGNACSRLDCGDGWVEDENGRLLAWIPERYRKDIQKDQKLVIGRRHHRVIRPTIDYERLMYCLEKGWASIYRSNA